ncbi:MAG TPA: hypothetical protein VGR62_06715 [Candidatus Binatia bacterium]|jgi:hypothetical protein|nr:hypothetical protein [Candidatus Binatia bacterium]
MHATATKLEPLLYEETILPVQYADMNRGDGRRPPEHRLLFAVLEDAVRCWQIYEGAPGRRAQRLFREVGEWFASDDDSSPFTFIAICQLFAIDPAYLRGGLHRWGDNRRATGATVVPFRVRRVGGLRHSVTSGGLGLRSVGR